jgi:hypothetical protein
MPGKAFRFSSYGITCQVKPSGRLYMASHAR